MSLESLIPVSEEVLSSMILNPNQALGKNIEIHTKQKGFPSLKNTSIAIIGISEIRNAFFPSSVYKIEEFRKSFYQLFPGRQAHRCDVHGPEPAGI